MTHDSRRRFQNIYDFRPDIDRNPGRRAERFPEITDADFWRLYTLAKPYSMIHVPGFFNLYQSVRYIVENRIIGGLAECGSFLGGAAIFIGLAARHFGTTRPLWAFDTFTGFPAGSHDSRLGEPVRGPRYADFLGAVRTNFDTVLGPSPEVTLVQGDVRETLPVTETGELALLRLDTDFYDSTRAELEHLYPRLVPGGVLIVDDYGLYDGSRRAVDEYFLEHGARPLLNRIDSGTVSGVKPGPG